MLTYEMNREEAVTLLREYRTALVRLDELSLMLTVALLNLYTEWDEDATAEGVVAPLGQISKQFRDAIPKSIKATRVIENEDADA